MVCLLISRRHHGRRTWSASSPNARRVSVVGDFNTDGKQTISTFTVGFGINSNLLRHTAQVGNGLYYSADNAQGLKQALLDIINVVQTRSGQLLARMAELEAEHDKLTMNYTEQHPDVVRIQHQIRDMQTQLRETESRLKNLERRIG